MTSLASHLDSYLELRRKLGFKLRLAGGLLHRFVAFAEKKRSRFITAKLACEWASQPADCEPAQWATREERLSHFAGEAQAALLANKLARIIGHNGGRFYINEFKRIFKPIQQETDLEYTYVCMLEDDDPWFPRPQARAE